MWNVIHEIVALHNTHLGKIIRRSGKIANLVKWRHLWRHNDVISVCFYNFILYLCYFWTDWDHPYTKMTGLMSTFQKKKCFRSWRHWWRHKRHLWRHIGFKTWKRHNFVVFQSIWTIDTPKSRYWNELSKK